VNEALGGGDVAFGPLLTGLPGSWPPPPSHFFAVLVVLTGLGI